MTEEATEWVEYVVEGQPTHPRDNDEPKGYVYPFYKVTFRSDSEQFASLPTVLRTAVEQEWPHLKVTVREIEQKVHTTVADYPVAFRLLLDAMEKNNG